MNIRFHPCLSLVNLIAFSVEEINAEKNNPIAAPASKDKYKIVVNLEKSVVSNLPKAVRIKMNKYIA